MLICKACLVMNDEPGISRPKYCEKSRRGDPDGKDPHDWVAAETEAGAALLLRRQMRDRDGSEAAEVSLLVDRDGDRHVELPRLTGEVLGMELPPEVATRVEFLRAWAARRGDKAACALFCAFHPPIAAIDARPPSPEGKNPMGVDDVELARVRLMLIQLRDTFLLPSCWDADKAVVLSHAIRVLSEIRDVCQKTYLETEGVGPETG